MGGSVFKNKTFIKRSSMKAPAPLPPGQSSEIVCDIDIKENEAILSSHNAIVYKFDSNKQWIPVSKDYVMLVCLDCLGVDDSYRYKINVVEKKQKILECPLSSTTKVKIKDSFVRWQIEPGTYGARFIKEESAKKYHQQLHELINDVSLYAKVTKPKIRPGVSTASLDSTGLPPAIGLPPTTVPQANTIKNVVLNVEVKPSEFAQFQASSDTSVKDFLSTVCTTTAVNTNNYTFVYTDLVDIIDIQITVSQLKTTNLRLIKIKDLKKHSAAFAKVGKKKKTSSAGLSGLFSRSKSNVDHHTSEADEFKLNYNDPIWRSFLDLANLHEGEVHNQRVATLIEDFVGIRGGYTFLQQVNDQKMSALLADDLNNLAGQVHALMSPEPTATMSHAYSNDKLTTLERKGKRRAPKPPTPLENKTSPFNDKQNNIYERIKKGSPAASPSGKRRAPAAPQSGSVKSPSLSSTASVTSNSSRATHGSSSSGEMSIPTSPIVTSDAPVFEGRKHSNSKPPPMFIAPPPPHEPPPHDDMSSPVGPLSPVMQDPFDNYEIKKDKSSKKQLFKSEELDVTDSTKNKSTVTEPKEKKTEPVIDQSHKFETDIKLEVIGETNVDKEERKNNEISEISQKVALNEKENTEKSTGKKSEVEKIEKSPTELNDKPEVEITQNQIIEKQDTVHEKEKTKSNIAEPPESKQQPEKQQHSPDQRPIQDQQLSKQQLLDQTAALQQLLQMQQQVQTMDPTQQQFFQLQLQILQQQILSATAQQQGVAPISNKQSTDDNKPATPPNTPTVTNVSTIFTPASTSITSSVVTTGTSLSAVTSSSTSSPDTTPCSTTSTVTAMVSSPSVTESKQGDITVRAPIQTDNSTSSESKLISNDKVMVAKVNINNENTLQEQQLTNQMSDDKTKSISDTVPSLDSGATNNVSPSSVTTGVTKRPPSGLYAKLKAKTAASKPVNAPVEAKEVNLSTPVNNANGRSFTTNVNHQPLESDKNISVGVDVKVSKQNKPEPTERRSSLKTSVIPEISSSNKVSAKLDSNTIFEKDVDIKVDTSAKETTRVKNESIEEKCKEESSEKFAIVTAIQPEKKIKKLVQPEKVSVDKDETKYVNGKVKPLDKPKTDSVQNNDSLSQKKIEAQLPKAVINKDNNSEIIFAPTDAKSTISEERSEKTSTSAIDISMNKTKGEQPITKVLSSVDTPSSATTTTTTPATISSTKALPPSNISLTKVATPSTNSKTNVATPPTNSITKPIQPASNYVAKPLPPSTKTVAKPLSPSANVVAKPLPSSTKTVAKPLSPSANDVTKVLPPPVVEKKPLTRNSSYNPDSVIVFPDQQNKSQNEEDDAHQSYKDILAASRMKSSARSSSFVFGKSTTLPGGNDKSSTLPDGAYRSRSSTGNLPNEEFNTRSRSSTGNLSNDARSRSSTANSNEEADLNRIKSYRNRSNTSDGINEGATTNTIVEKPISSFLKPKPIVSKEAVALKETTKSLKPNIQEDEGVSPRERLLQNISDHGTPSPTMERKQTVTKPTKTLNEPKKEIQLPSKTIDTKKDIRHTKSPVIGADILAYDTKPKPNKQTVPIKKEYLFAFPSSNLSKNITEPVLDKKPPGVKPKPSSANGQIITDPFSNGSVKFNRPVSSDLNGKLVNTDSIKKQPPKTSKKPSIKKQQSDANEDNNVRPSDLLRASHTLPRQFKKTPNLIQRDIDLRATTP